MKFIWIWHNQRVSSFFCYHANIVCVLCTVHKTKKIGYCNKIWWLFWNVLGWISMDLTKVFFFQPCMKAIGLTLLTAMISQLWKKLSSGHFKDFKLLNMDWLVFVIYYCLPWITDWKLINRKFISHVRALKDLRHFPFVYWKTLFTQKQKQIFWLRNNPACQPQVRK